jgi:hypothetical protein
MKVMILETNLLYPAFSYTDDYDTLEVDFQS